MERAYVRLLNMMRGKQNHSIVLGVMTSPSSVKIGELELDSDELLFSSLTLKAGDLVAVAKVSDELYVVLGRLMVYEPAT